MGYFQKMKVKLNRGFYQDPDVVSCAKALVGKVLCTNVGGQYTSGIITETEAYSGSNDKASHANNGKRTKRNESMYLEGGHAYVYLCYGIHHLFNVVTAPKDQADAVLIRAIEPLEGLEIMLNRRNQKELKKDLFKGPGKVSQALGISLKEDRKDLQGESIWIEDRNINVTDDALKVSARIGIGYAGEDALLPWRFEL